MKITVILNGVKVHKDIPTSWDKVTYGQFLKLAECGSDIAKIVSVFTDIDEAILRKSKIINLEAVTSYLSFLNVAMPDLEVPDKVLGYDIPKNLEFETVAQYSDLQQEINKTQGDQNAILKSYPLFVATYAMSPYDPLQVEEFSKQFLNAPCMEVLAIGNFTLVRSIGSNLGISPNYLRGVTLMKKLRLVIRSWRSNLAFTIRFYLWKRRLPTNGRNWYFGR